MRYWMNKILSAKYTKVLRYIMLIYIADNDMIVPIECKFELYIRVVFLLGDHI